MSDGLKPCPFCGNEMNVFEDRGDFTPRCMTCDYWLTPHDPPEVVGWFQSHAEAVEFGNRRPGEEKLQARIAELEEALLQAKVAMDYSADTLECMDVVNAEYNDTAVLEPLFDTVYKALEGIPDYRTRYDEMEKAALERAKLPFEAKDEL